MMVFLNGQFVPEAEARVSVFDRAFLYGDSLFETIRVSGARLFQWEEHNQRLATGADCFGIPLPFTPESLRQHAEKLIALNEVAEAVLRLNLSRGVGPRGYSPRGAHSPTLVMSLHPCLAPGTTPAAWRLATANVRVPEPMPLALFKTGSQLWHVLARAEADAARADEALLVSSQGFVLEGSCSNVFWLEKEKLFTPPAENILPGVTRSLVFHLCRELGIEVEETRARPDRLRAADGLFLSLSSAGIVEGVSLDGQPLNRSPLSLRVYSAWAAALRENALRKSQNMA